MTMSLSHLAPRKLNAVDYQVHLWSLKKAAVLRKLTEQGAACALILDARLERHERRLTELSSDPASSLAAIAAEVRSINELKPDLEELHGLLDALNAHARELRASWLAVR